MSNEIQVFIDRISKWINKKVNKYISMMIKYTGPFHGYVCDQNLRIFHF